MYDDTEHHLVAKCYPLCQTNHRQTDPSAESGVKKLALSLLAAPYVIDYDILEDWAISLIDMLY